MLTIRGVPVRGMAAVFGGFLLQFTMGSFYSFGNISTYMTSYMRQNSESPNVTNTEFVVVQSTWGMTQGVVMPFSGFLVNVIGQKASMVAGSIIFSSGCALTYFTINEKLWMVATTFGFVSALGQNIALIPTMTTGMNWFPHRKGLAMGCVVGGFGGGSLVFNYIITAIINPNNISPATSGKDEGYFTDSDLLGRVPSLLMSLASIYLGLGLLACLLVTQPPANWLSRSQFKDNRANNLDSRYVMRSEAIKSKEFFILWTTRLSVVMLSNVISAYYKVFGQTFIRDDKFLSLVGSISSIFNCSGRLLWGLIMDRVGYKVSMSMVATLLVLLVSTFFLTSIIGVQSSDCTELMTNRTISSPTLGSKEDLKAPHVTTKAVFALWVWAIFLTFSGTFSMQPAVTTQTFGQRHGGSIYAFLFSSDIINNLLVATLFSRIIESYGWLCLYLVISVNGVVALIATLLFPRLTEMKVQDTTIRCNTQL